MPREVRRAIGRRGDFLQRFLKAGRGGAFGQQQVGVPFDDRQDVIEIVRHTGGQLANGFHFLRLPELRFQVAAVRDVLHAAFEVKHTALGIANRPDVFLHPDRRTVATAQGRFVATHRVVPANQHLPPFAIGGINVQIARIHAQQGFPIGKSEQLDHRRIGIHDFSFRRGFAETDGKVVEEGQVTALRLLQGAPLCAALEDEVCRGRQAGIVFGRLKDVIVQAGLHRFHGNLLAAGAGEHDHRAIGPACLDRSQHGQSIRPAQLKIGDDQLAFSGFQRPGKAFRVVDVFDLQVAEIAPQFTRGEGAVLRIVVHQQDTQRVFAENLL